MPRQGPSSMNPWYVTVLTTIGLKIPRRDGIALGKTGVLARQGYNVLGILPTSEGGCIKSRCHNFFTSIGFRREIHTIVSCLIPCVAIILLSFLNTRSMPQGFSCNNRVKTNQFPVAATPTWTTQGQLSPLPRS